jgi:hypothetical protein
MPPVKAELCAAVTENLVFKLLFGVRWQEHTIRQTQQVGKADTPSQKFLVEARVIFRLSKEVCDDEAHPAHNCLCEISLLHVLVIEHAMGQFSL